MVVLVDVLFCMVAIIYYFCMIWLPFFQPLQFLQLVMLHKNDNKNI